MPEAIRRREPGPSSPETSVTASDRAQKCATIDVGYQGHPDMVGTQPNRRSRPKLDFGTRLAFMRDARGGSGSSRGQDRGPQITLACRMSLTSSGE